MNRRSLLQMLGVGMGVAVATPAWAQKIRILPGAGEGAPSAGGDLALSQVGRVLAGVRVGERRGHAGRVTFRLGDFKVVAPDLPLADVVTLDRVVCCDPDFTSLLTAAADQSPVLVIVDDALPSALPIHRLRNSRLPKISL